MCRGLVRGDRIVVLVAGQHAADVGAVKADVDGAVGSVGRAEARAKNGAEDRRPAVDLALRLMPYVMPYCGQQLDGGRRHSDGGSRVELERAVDHVHLCPMVERCEGLLEPPLPQLTPRAHHVGPDLDLHVWPNTARTRSLPPTPRAGFPSAVTPRDPARRRCSFTSHGGKHERPAALARRPKPGCRAGIHEGKASHPSHLPQASSRRGQVGRSSETVLVSPRRPCWRRDWR